MAHLVIVDGDRVGERIPVERVRSVVGRDAGVDIPIRDTAVSRRHCVLTFEDGSWVVSDLGTTNGTRVNGRPVSKARLCDGDEISLGGSLLLFADPEEPSVARSIEGQTRLADATPGSRWRAQQLDELLALGERASAAGTPRAIIEALREWMEQTLFIEVMLVRRRAGSRWATIFETGAMTVGPELEKESRRSAAHGDVRWIESKRILCATLVGANPTHMVLARVAPGDPIPTDWELRLLACAARLVGAALGVPRSPSAVELPPLDRTESPVMKKAMELLERVAGSHATVLLRGESGTGKELAARWLHERGPRALQPFVAVNCGALPETLLESELFGHEAGAFTGATARHAGRFERANGGTLFLDEVAELSAAAQTRLLRVLETRQVDRVGGTEPVPVDVRVVAATHRDLEAMVSEGSFREDLFYRLAVITVALPPLRERLEDLEGLTRRFLHEEARAQERAVADLQPATLEKLATHGWPGNVRELRNAVAHAVVVATGAAVTPSDLPPHIGRAAEPRRDAGATLTLPASLRDLEEAAVRAALESADGNKSRAARILGINRATLYAKLDLYGIPT